MVFYKPKYTISGDFYWFYKNGSTVYVAVVDCTGHGISGAFMSMIGNNLLENIVKVKKVTSPAEILTHMDREIHEVVKQKEASNLNYEMDVAIIKVDKLPEMHRKVEFAGAKRPLYVVLNNDKKVVVIDGDRKSIGNKDYEVSFETKTLYLNKKDVMYLTTNGFVDQGNLERQKFGTRKLFDLIEANVNEPFDEQKKIFEKELHRHQKGTQQRDDITLLGIRL